MLKSNIIVVILLITTAICTTQAISRWFSASYADLRVALRRYGHCVGDLAPLKELSMNETEYLIHQMKVFLDQANYDNEQMANVTVLMDNICRSEADSEYPISLNIDVNKYNNSANGKENRCRSIDEALDAMYIVFKRAAYNKTEPLDFSIIQFFPKPVNNEPIGSYNLTDLINTSWIKSDTQIEHICKITGAIKEYVQLRNSNSTAQDRSQQQSNVGAFGAIFDLIDRFVLEPLFGLQRRLYWESNNSYEIVYSGLSNQFDNLRKGFGNRYKATRSRFASMLSSSSSSSSNSTNNLKLNKTENLHVNLTTFAPLSSSTSSFAITTTTPSPTSTSSKSSNIASNVTNTSL